MFSTFTPFSFYSVYFCRGFDFFLRLFGVCVTVPFVVFLGDVFNYSPFRFRLTMRCLPCAQQDSLSKSTSLSNQLPEFTLSIQSTCMIDQDKQTKKKKKRRSTKPSTQQTVRNRLKLKVPVAGRVWSIKIRYCQYTFTIEEPWMKTRLTSPWLLS